MRGGGRGVRGGTQGGLERNKRIRRVLRVVKWVIVEYERSTKECSNLMRRTVMSRGVTHQVTGIERQRAVACMAVIAVAHRLRFRSTSSSS